MGVKGRALTFLTPEDESAWRQLRRQGAPALPELDVAHLLSEGDWRYVAASLVESAAAAPRGPRPVRAGQQTWHGRPRRRPRGPYRSDQRQATAGG